MEKMKLQEFISETLTQIIGGVKDAQEGAKKLGGKVSPFGLEYKSDAIGQRGVDRELGATTRDIEFDLAVTVTEGAKKKAGIAVMAASLFMGGQASKSLESGLVNKIKFSVPVIFPPQEYFKKKGD